jgi:hypothetical protein
MPATVIEKTAGASLAALTSSTHYANKYGFLLRVNPAADSADGVLLAFASDATVFFPLKPGDSLPIMPEDAGSTSKVYVKRSASTDVVVSVLIGAAAVAAG